MPLTMRYRAARDIVRDAGALAHEFFDHREFLFAGHTGRASYALRSIGTLRSLLCARLAATFPGDPQFDDQRSGIAFAAANHSGWVIEPVCGAANFVRGIPLYAIALAFVADGVCEIAAIHDPERGQLYHARRGDGAYCEHAGADAPMTVAACTALEGALVSLDDDSGSRDPEYLAVRHELMERGALVRALGATALELAYVAAGRSDGFVGLRTDPQLLLGGLLLVEEAGGGTQLPGPSPDPRAASPSWACAPGIASDLAQAVQSTGWQHVVPSFEMVEPRAH